jgi:hypothetical protein
MLKRAVAVAAIALATLGVTVGPAYAAGFIINDHSGKHAPGEPALNPARITAYRGTLNLLNTKLDNLGAQLLDAATDEQIRGVLIKFVTVGGRYLGSAYTNYSGDARLAAPENVGPGTVQEIISGHYASFVGMEIVLP